MPPCDDCGSPYRIPMSLVSILVLVDAALRLDGVRNDVHYRCVSILVLVDAALRPYFFFHTVHVYLCFNPCFSGCRPATRITLGKGSKRIQFQSLF